MRVLVIGGGLAGLTAARALVGAGYDAHVRERAERVGGVLGTDTVDGFVREHAASSFLGGPARGARALCKQLGVEIEVASPRAKRRWIYIDGRLRAVPSDPWSLARSDLLTWRGKLALLGEPLRPGRAHEDESVHAFAARRLGPEAARALVAPFVTGVYAADAHDISLEAGFPRLAALDSTGGIARGAGRDLAKDLGKTIIRVMSGKPRRSAARRGLCAPKGGLGALVDALAAQLGGRVRTRSPVTAVRPLERGVEVDGERWDACVLAVPASAGHRLVSSIGTLSTRLAAFERAPAAIVYLGYDEAAVPRAGDGFGFLTAGGEDVRVLGVVFESVVWADRAPSGRVLLRCIFGGSRDPEAVSLSDAALVEHATRDVTTVLGATAGPVHASVVRHLDAIAQYRVGHRERVRAAVAAARTHRIALAGADYRGSGVNDLCADADTIVEELRSWG